MTTLKELAKTITEKAAPVTWADVALEIGHIRADIAGLAKLLKGGTVATAKAKAPAAPAAGPEIPVYTKAPPPPDCPVCGQAFDSPVGRAYHVDRTQGKPHIMGARGAAKTALLRVERAK